MMCSEDVALIWGGTVTIYADFPLFFQIYYEFL